MTMMLQTIGSITGEWAMVHRRLQGAVDKVLQHLEQEAKDGDSLQELVPTPMCMLDLETYDLLVASTGGAGYPAFFTRAVRSLEPIISVGQLNQVIAAAKRKRAASNYKMVHTKIGKNEFEWTSRTAVEMGTKPVRILEAVIFLFVRATETAI